MAGGDAPACVGGVEEASFVVADRGGHREEKVVEAHGAGDHFAHRGIVLQGQEDVEEEGSQSQALGVFPLQEEG